jgi:hypothetical protein
MNLSCGVEELTLIIAVSYRSKAHKATMLTHLEYLLDFSVLPSTLQTPFVPIAQVNVFSDGVPSCREAFPGNDRNIPT